MRHLLPPRLLDGPLPSLPRPLDGLSERWWALSPRLRVLAGALAAMSVLALLTVETGRSPHGPDVPVLVAARDLPAGHALGPDDLVGRPWPRDLLPEEAGTTPTGTLTGPVPAGMPVTPSMVADGGVAALVEEGAAAVALPAETLSEDSLGARVDLVAPGGDGATRVVTRDARVLHFDDHRVWVEVAATDAAEVASAGRGDGLVAVLHAP